MAASGLNAINAATKVAINNQALVPAGTPFTPAAPAADFAVASLTFTDPSNWFVRTFNGSVAHTTPDANGATKFVEKRIRSNSKAVANWTYGSNPASQADLHWNGNAGWGVR